MAKGCSIFSATVAHGVRVAAPQEVEETGEGGKVLIGRDTGEEGDYQHPLAGQGLFPYQAAAGQDGVVQMGGEVEIMVTRSSHFSYTLAQPPLTVNLDRKLDS